MLVSSTRIYIRHEEGNDLYWVVTSFQVQASLSLVSACANMSCALSLFWAGKAAEAGILHYPVLHVAMSLAPPPPCVLCCSEFGPTSALCFVLQWVWPHLHPVFCVAVSLAPPPLFVLCCSEFGPTTTLCFVLQWVWPHLRPVFCVAVSLAPPPPCVLCCSEFGPTTTLCFVLQWVWPHHHPVFCVAVNLPPPLPPFPPYFVLQSVWPHFQSVFCVSVSLAPPPPWATERPAWARSLVTSSAWWPPTVTVQRLPSGSPTPPSKTVRLFLTLLYFSLWLLSLPCAGFLLLQFTTSRQSLFELLYINQQSFWCEAGFTMKMFTASSHSPPPTSNQPTTLCMNLQFWFGNSYVKIAVLIWKQICKNGICKKSTEKKKEKKDFSVWSSCLVDWALYTRHWIII